MTRDADDGVGQNDHERRRQPQGEAVDEIRRDGKQWADTEQLHERRVIAPEAGRNGVVEVTLGHRSENRVVRRRAHSRSRGRKSMCS